MVPPSQIWTGDWRTIIRARLHPRGAETVSDFAKQYPALPYIKLARLLGTDVAAPQLQIMQFEEAKAEGSLREAAKDALCRTVHLHLKRGWKKGKHAEFNTAGVYADWLALVRFSAFCPERLPTPEAVWNGLKASEPPAGWIPSGPDDALIVAAFDEGGLQTTN
jgi:hypothetical protein